MILFIHTYYYFILMNTFCYNFEFYLHVHHEINVVFCSRPSINHLQNQVEEVAQTKHYTVSMKHVQ